MANKNRCEQSKTNPNKKKAMKLKAKKRNLNSKKFETVSSETMQGLFSMGKRNNSEKSAANQAMPSKGVKRKQQDSKCVKTLKNNKGNITIREHNSNDNTQRKNLQFNGFVDKLEAKIDAQGLKNENLVKNRKEVKSVQNISKKQLKGTSGSILLTKQVVDDNQKPNPLPCGATSSKNKVRGNKAQKIKKISPSAKFITHAKRYENQVTKNTKQKNGRIPKKKNNRRKKLKLKSEDIVHYAQEVRAKTSESQLPKTILTENYILKQDKRGNNLKAKHNNFVKNLKDPKSQHSTQYLILKRKHSSEEPQNCIKNINQTSIKLNKSEIGKVLPVKQVERYEQDKNVNDPKFENITQCLTPKQKNSFGKYRNKNQSSIRFNKSELKKIRLVTEDERFKQDKQDNREKKLNKPNLQNILQKPIEQANVGAEEGLQTSKSGLIGRILPLKQIENYEKSKEYHCGMNFKSENFTGNSSESEAIQSTGINTSESFIQGDETKTAEKICPLKKINCMNNTKSENTENIPRKPQENIAETSSCELIGRVLPVMQEKDKQGNNQMNLKDEQEVGNENWTEAKSKNRTIKEKNSEEQKAETSSGLIGIISPVKKVNIQSKSCEENLKFEDTKILTTLKKKNISGEGTDCWKKKNPVLTSNFSGLNNRSSPIKQAQVHPVYSGVEKYNQNCMKSLNTVVKHSNMNSNALDEVHSRTESIGLLQVDCMNKLNYNSSTCADKSENKVPVKDHATITPDHGSFDSIVERNRPIRNKKSGNYYKDQINGCSQMIEDNDETPLHHQGETESTQSNDAAIIRNGPIEGNQVQLSVDEFLNDSWRKMHIQVEESEERIRSQFKRCENFVLPKPEMKKSADQRKTTYSLMGMFKSLFKRRQTL